MDEMIKSLEARSERIGVMCVDGSGGLPRTETLETVAGEDSARSVKSINEIGNSCKGSTQAWWHTHPTTLSSLSAEDRISAGNLKSWLGDDIMCAAGIEGFSCHSLDEKVPRVLSKRWGPGYFDRIKRSPVASVILDSGKKWDVKKSRESDASHMLCSTDEKHPGIVKCSAIDWDTGFNHFPVGAFTNVIFTGSVDVTPAKDGFDLLAAPVDEKLNCVSINAGKDGGTRIMYCR
jgi:hypothetical protein